MLDENGVVIAVDNAMIKSGVVLSELHPIDQDVIKQVFETGQPAYTDVYDAYGKERITGLAPRFGRKLYIRIRGNRCEPGEYTRNFR